MRAPVKKSGRHRGHGSHIRSVCCGGNIARPTNLILTVAHIYAFWGPPAINHGLPHLISGPISGLQVSATFFAG